jgi:hypothetical protein
MGNDASMAAEDLNQEGGQENAPSMFSPVDEGNILKAPRFQTSEGWGPGYGLAVADGGGAVVGPTSINPNVLAQTFQTESGVQYKVTAEASSVSPLESEAAIQVNWVNKDNQFIGLERELFVVGQENKRFDHQFSAPDDATVGGVYVVPGGVANIVRYREMSLVELDPIDDFWEYEFFGVAGVYLFFATLVMAVGAIVGLTFRHRAAVICRSTFKSLQATRVSIVHHYTDSPKIATAMIAAFAVLGIVYMAMGLEYQYERQYDQYAHQSFVDITMQWNAPGLDLGANPMSNFGIQYLMQPHFSPTYLVGSFFDSDIRIPVQAAVQAILMLFILVWLCSWAGMSIDQCFGVSFVAVAFCWIPYLSGGRLPHNATLGLVWQEASVATLLASALFLRIGTSESPYSIWPAIGLLLTIFWLFISLPYMAPFFVITTAFICMGALLSATSVPEVKSKILYSVLIAAVMVISGVLDYLLLIFSYTPQIAFSSLNVSYLGSTLLKYTASIPLLGFFIGSYGVFVFYAIFLLGSVFTIRYGSEREKRILYCAVSLEAMILVAPIVNAYFNFIAIQFTYVEMMGIPIVAVVVGMTVWRALLLLNDPSDIWRLSRLDVVSAAWKTK